MKVAFAELKSPYLEGELEFVVPACEFNHNLALAIGESPFNSVDFARGAETGQPLHNGVEPQELETPLRVAEEGELQTLGLLEDGVESENGAGARACVVKFQWQQMKNGQALSLGLTLGGEDKTLKAPLPGRIRLIEVGGSGKGKGSAELADERLIATFHGTFHRDPRAPANARIRFEIFGASQAMGPHHPDVLGFDPECVLGVDALVLTFVNREFIVPFPFFLDSLSEGQSLEFVAVAEAVNGQTITELGRSSPLSLPISQKHVVETTSMHGGVAQKYTGTLVGHQILHHEDYLLEAASHAATATPTVLTSQRIPISPKGSPGFSFEKYKNGSLQIILMNDLLDDLVPTSAELKRLIRMPKGITSKITDKWIRLVLRGEVSLRLNDLFLDSGFTGMSALWDSDKAAAQLVTAFKGSFVQRTPGAGRFWELRSRTPPLSVPFWTFFVVFDNVNVKTLGLGEGLHLGHRINQGSKVFHLPHPLPIGSGNKQISLPIRIDTSKLTNHVTTDLDGAQRPNHSVTQGQIKGLADRVAAQLANSIAHEVAHSLGLMHDIGLEVAGPYTEKTGNSSMSIMSSAAEDSAPATEAVFSNQAKVIWQLAFGVRPRFQPAPLRSKTWTGNEWKTVDWAERMRRLHRRYAIEQLAIPSYVQTNLLLGKVPPFAGKPPKVQKGTHVP